MKCPTCKAEPGEYHYRRCPQRGEGKVKDMKLGNVQLTKNKYGAFQIAFGDNRIGHLDRRDIEDLKNLIIESLDEQSEKEQASEENVKHNICLMEKMFREGKLTKKQLFPFSAKQQEEPKELDDDCKLGCCECLPFQHQKESESKEEKPRWNTARSVRDIVRDEPAILNRAVIANTFTLEKPKGMSIGEALTGFTNWYYRREDVQEALPAVCIDELADETFIKLWQEWLTSLKK